MPKVLGSSTNNIDKHFVTDDGFPWIIKIPPFGCASFSEIPLSDADDLQVYDSDSADSLRAGSQPHLFCWNLEQFPQRRIIGPKAGFNKAHDGRAKSQGRCVQFRISKGLLTVAGACHIKAASQNKDELTGVASDDINASFTVHMKDFYEIPLLWGFIVNLFLHPVSHAVRNFLDQVPILNNKVIHALGIGSRRSKPGCFKKLTDLFFRYQFIAKIPDAPALTEKFQRRIRVQHGTGDGIHLSLRAAGIVKGPVGHTATQ